MKKLITGLSIFLGVSISGFGQSANHDQYKETISYLQGNSIYDRGVMTFFEEMRDYGFAHSDPFMRDAQTLACIFMLIFFSLKCYEMMAGDKKLEIMPLLRPFALVILLMWWPIFCQIVAFPTDLIAAKTEALFGTQNDTNNALRLDRAAYMIEMADQLVTQPKFQPMVLRTTHHHRPLVGCCRSLPVSPLPAPVASAAPALSSPATGSRGRHHPPFQS